MSSEFYGKHGEVVFPSDLIGKTLYFEQGVPVLQTEESWIEWGSGARQPTIQLVQAQFTPGGKKYTYNCPGAEVGDIITGPGATGPATVVEMGKTASGYKGPIKTATILRKRSPLMHGDTLKRDENSFNKYTIEVEDGDLVGSLEKAPEKAKELKVKKQEYEAEQKALAEERARLRKVAIDSLEKSAKEGDTAAAIELLRINK